MFNYIYDGYFWTKGKQRESVSPSVCPYWPLTESHPLCVHFSTSPFSRKTKRNKKKKNTVTFFSEGKNDGMSLADSKSRVMCDVAKCDRYLANLSICPVRWVARLAE